MGDWMWRERGGGAEDGPQLREVLGWRREPGVMGLSWGGGEGRPLEALEGALACHTLDAAAFRNALDLFNSDSQPKLGQESANGVSVLCKAKGLQFHSQSGRVAGLPVCAVLGRARGNPSMFLSPSLSLSLFKKKCF